MDLNDVRSTNVGGIKTACVGRVDLCKIVEKVCLDRRTNKNLRNTPILIFSANGESVSLVGKDSTIKKVINSADLVHADGQSVVLMSKFFGAHKIPERTATTDMIHDIPKHVPRKLRHYFLGGTEEVVKKAAQLYQQQYENVEVVGSKHGYFSEVEELAVCEEINALDVDVLWVGLGKPKEQLFCMKYKKHLNPAVVVTCGGCFNFITGNYSRAPMWMQKAGMEWFHRMLLNPRKLFWRYFTTNPHSIYCMVKNGFVNSQ